MKFSIITLGCKVNSYESEAILSLLESKGWIYQNSNEVSDVYIINTCTVTSTSDQKSRQVIRSCRRKNENAVIVGMGCYTQTHPQEAIELVDVLLGTDQRNKVYDLVNEFLLNKQKINYVKDIKEIKCFEELELSKLTTHTRGFVKIQDGCENFCSYCAIPFSRGKIRSRNPENVINEINQLVNNDVKEIIISGINTGTYGQDLGYINLAKLIEKIMIETNLVRLRLSSIELMEVSDELLDIMKKYQNRIAMHLHIPLQAGSDGVLQRMKRKYLTNDYYLLINKIRNIFPDIAVTTDCLAGFVGETEEEFNEAYEFIKKINFADMHIFPYSRRKGTVADEMKGHLNGSVISLRAHKLLELAEIMKNEYNHKFINTVQEVLVERTKDDFYEGHTSNYLNVLFKSDCDVVNQIIKVKITKIENNKIYGKEIK